MWTLRDLSVFTLSLREHAAHVGLGVDQCGGRVHVGRSSLWEVDINNLNMAVTAHLREISVLIVLMSCHHFLWFFI